MSKTNGNVRTSPAEPTGESPSSFALRWAALALPDVAGAAANFRRRVVVAGLGSAVRPKVQLPRTCGAQLGQQGAGAAAQLGVAGVRDRLALRLGQLEGALEHPSRVYLDLVGDRPRSRRIAASALVEFLESRRRQANRLVRQRKCRHPIHPPMALQFEDCSA